MVSYLLLLTYLEGLKLRVLFLGREKLLLYYNPDFLLTDFYFYIDTIKYRYNKKITSLGRSISIE